MAAIDVLLPVRNGLPFLGEAIDSIRKQTFPDWRLLILDHGSSDGSVALSQRYEEQDPRIKVFSFPKADGLAGLLNVGLEKCDCKYVLRQDADDVSISNRMSVVVDRFNENPDLLAIGGDAFTIDEAGRPIGYIRFPTNPSAVRAAGFFYNPMLHPTIAANLSALRQWGAAYGKDFVNSTPEMEFLRVKGLAEDYFLFGQLALLGPCANLGTPLIQYRIHRGSVGISNPKPQIRLALQVSRFLAKSFCVINGLPEFDPGPFCNHADYVFDFQLNEYTEQFERMAESLRRGMGESADLERELAFRWILATRVSGRMAARYLRFHFKYGAMPREWRTVRNWLLRDIRRGKYVYRANTESP